MADRKFAHLHLHTHYSLLDGFNRIAPLVEQTKKLGMSGLAITDHGNLYGAIEFYAECKKAGINPILGYEAYLAPGARTEKKAARQGDAYSHLTLLAKNTTGFKNLVKLSSIAFLEGFYYHPRIDREVLEAHSEGLICLSGCLAGEFNQSILRDNLKEAKKISEWFARVFKKDYYIEIQNNGIGLQDQCTPVAAEIADAVGVPLVATADAHYLCAEDAEAHDVLFCINTGQKRDPNKRKYPEEKMKSPYFVRSPEDMYRLFPDYADAVARSQEIADAVSIDLDFNTRHFPVFVPPKEKTPEQFLRELCEKGLGERYGETPPENAVNRLEHELGVITRMGFASYFLIVWDFVRFAREQGIPSTARGSGCGAIVSYVLYLSHVCPLEYDLLFERFLDPNRSEAPDIDIDFCQDRRELVIQYVKQKYGAESVAQIGTFGTLAAKAALKDVGRVLDIPLDKVNALCKLVPMKGAIAADLNEAMASPDFKREYENDPQTRQWVDIARKLEGSNRNVGTHAAGVVIANGPITDYVPVQRVSRKTDSDEGKGKGEAAVTTQWEMGILEKVGLLKMDFLGLRNLTVLDNCVKLIKKTRGLDIDPMTFPLDDKETYALLQRGDAKGVFQLESEGIRELLKRMKPDNIRDLIAVLALYRPGPLGGGMVDSYVNRKHGRETWEYPHPVLREILDETYGVMIYQEQVMRILNRLGGIDLAKAYACIKAISKKKQETIDESKVGFISGCEKNGVDSSRAEEIFNLIVFFGGYGFNKCVVGATELVHAVTGERATVAELFARRRAFSVHALGEDGRLRPRNVSDVVWNGRKPVFRLTTQLGHQFVATDNHPLRTLSGWTNLGDLKPGDRIATPRKLVVPTSATWPRHELITLAGLLAEGNTCHPSTLYLDGNDPALVNDFAEAVRLFPDTRAKIYARANSRRLEVQVNTGRDTRFQPGAARGNAAATLSITRSGAYVWAKSLDLLGKKATVKRVPAPVFGLCEGDIELFLGRLWAGDGFIANEKRHVPFYATSSPQLAKDVQHLLLRLGIVSRIHFKQFKSRGGLRPGFTVHLLGEGAAEAFLQRIAPHCFGRETAVALLRDHVSTAERGMTSKDTLPIEVRAWVDEERRARTLTWEQLESQADISTQEFYGTPSVGKRGFRRSTIARLANFFSSPRLAAVASSDIYWDRVVSIEPIGVEDTYDLTIDVDHNFFADGLIVHNSHTAAYAQIGYQTAYLKAHFTAEYMAALLSSEIDDGNKRDIMVEHIADARRLGIEVLPPDIHRGLADFDVQNNRIVFGLTAIKGLGRGAAEEIVRGRGAGAKFKDLFDFCERVDRRTVTKAAIERLIQAGAFDSFGARKGQFLNVSRAVQAADERASDRRRGQKSMFDMFEGDGKESSTSTGVARDGGFVDNSEWPETEKLKLEKEALDFYISSHPLAQFDDQLRRFRSHECAEIVKAKHNTSAMIAGMVTQFGTRTTKSGKRFALFRVEDFTGQARCVLWSEEFARYKDFLADDAIALFEGVLERGERAEPDFIIKRIVTLDEARADFTKSLILRMPYGEDEATLKKLESVGTALQRHKGTCPVFLNVKDAKGRVAQLRLGGQFSINPATLVVADLEQILGPGGVLFAR